MNESKAEAMDRLRAEGRWSEASEFKDQVLRGLREAGVKRNVASEQAWLQMVQQFPPLPAEDVVGDGSRVQGLGDIPKAWGDIPSNASIQSEVSWVTANRLRVAAEEKPGGGVVRVRLDRAGSPAPSWAALSWLQTAILFPSKFAELSSRVLKDEQDEQAVVKREHMRIAEVQSLLAEMVDAEVE